MRHFGPHPAAGCIMPNSQPPIDFADRARWNAPVQEQEQAVALTPAQEQALALKPKRKRAAAIA